MQLKKVENLKLELKLIILIIKKYFAYYKLFLYHLDEFRIGSNKSRGFGRVKLNIKDIILEIKDDSRISFQKNKKIF